MIDKLVFEGSAAYKREDGGMARIVELYDPDTDEDENVFVRVQSFSETCHHPFLDSAQGKRLRVTVEIIDDPS